MYRMIIVTAIGNYVAEMTPGKEYPDNNDLIKMFLDTKNDVESGAFMEGWTPNETGGPPGVFAIAEGLDILAYHMEKEPDIGAPDMDKEPDITPIVLKPFYLENVLLCKGISKIINDVAVVFIYEVNGEPPTDVLEERKLQAILEEDIEAKNNYLSKDDYLLRIANDGKTRNFSQAMEVVEGLEDKYAELCKRKNGKAWSGWKGDTE